MRKTTTIIILGFIVILVSCKKEEPKDYVTLSGSITSQNSDSLMIRSRTYKKTIKVNKDGTFSDTLKVETGSFRLFDGKEGTSVYLKNGYDLKLTLDANEFDETIKYEGKGADSNNYLAQKALLDEKIIDFEKLMSLDRTNFDKNMNSIRDELSSLLSTTKNLDSAFIANETKGIESMSKQFTSFYEEKQAILAMKGLASPKFVNYENYAGGDTSLDDLKGKYVYIDMWATWCGPCKREIPFLKEVEKAYHGKNIAFVSISVDKQTAYDAWRKMVAEKELKGIQLFAKQDETFTDAYKISGIPRFILIDPEGNIVNADAPRPSDEKLKELFNSLSI